MALAKYFSKDFLAINQLLKSSNKNLQDTLDVKIGIAFDENALQTMEGRKSIDLMVRLLSRLYPKLVFIDLSNKDAAFKEEMKILATSINSLIEIENEFENVKALVLFGLSINVPNVSCPVIYLGSDRWIAKISSEQPQSFEESENPFGCGIAACIGASNLFKIVFNEFITDKSLDNHIQFSPLDYHHSSLINSELLKTQLDNVALVGLGAIGNGAMWALANCNLIGGQIDVIDHEDISITNLQRYVMSKEEHVGKSKAELAVEILQSAEVTANVYQHNWEGYMNLRNGIKIDTIAVAIDNKKDRIRIQSALPKRVFNSYTETNLVGIARHLDFLKDACMACGYIPTQREKNYTDEVAENCNIPAFANMVKDYINLNIGVDSVLFPQNTSSLLDVISNANEIPREKLQQFHGKTVNQFYSEYVCGGISLTLSKVDRLAIQIDAPLAFQSALAGILLIAELVIDASDLRKGINVKQQSHFYPLNKISSNNPFNHNLAKDKSGRCICQDQDYRNIYESKWTNK